MVNKLLVCPQHDCNAEIYKKKFSRRDKAFVSLLEKAHFGALLKFKIEVKFFHIIVDKVISYLLVLSGGVIKIREK